MFEKGVGLTAQQKNITENAMNKNGTFSQPILRRTVRKTISTGRVMSRRVIMTRRGLGWFSSGWEDLESAAACRAVESRETNIEPAAPGRPTQREHTCEFSLKRNTKGSAYR